MIQSVAELAILCGLLSIGAAMAGALFLASRLKAIIARRSLAIDGPEDATVFLVERAELIDASQPARDYLAMLGGGEGAWSYRLLARHLSETFPGFQRAILSLPRLRAQTLSSRDQTQALSLTMVGTRTRLALATSETDVVKLDRGSHAHIEAELESLRGLGDSMAFPAWRQSRDGAVSWANRAYLDLARRARGADTGIWPPPVLFPRIHAAGDAVTRAQLVTEEGTQHWFDCRIEWIEGDLFVTAIPADDLVRAERTLADFTQTFSRTFANLTVGIAVFDRHRQLIMFNPALTDLTKLPADLLLGRPKLESFLDALRARQMMPEPRDYANWRDHVNDVERAASDGTYSELWHLPGARTYRVTGRPQVDGAFALLIEDISAEVSLTRRFRTEIETGQSVLDTLPDAIAVFDRLGHLTMSNAGYDRLWKTETRDTSEQITVNDAIAKWSNACVTRKDVWSEARLFLGQDLSEDDWTARVQLTDGRAVAIHASALPGGMRMIRFSDRVVRQGAHLQPLEPGARSSGLLKA